jgi:adenylylsulfate reductase subunit A
MVKYAVENKATPAVAADVIDGLKERILRPLKTYNDHKDYTTDPDINPAYIKPYMFMFRLQKIMDEYAGGVTAAFKTNKALLERGLELLAFLKEDAEKLAASNIYELERCWENTHRMYQAETHVRTVLFREETRWPGYYFRADFPKMDPEWEVFVNCKLDPKTNEWEMKKIPIHRL